ncbi:MAG: YqaA family protein [Desulforhopalus sp.]
MEFLPAYFTTPSLPALFSLSFLAATVLPLGSEWLLVVMVLQGFDLPKVVMTATVGNFLGGCTTYLIGVWGSTVVIRSVLRISDHQLARANHLYEKYGSWSLLFSWLPVVGDPLCLLAGVFRTSWVRFGVLVFVGKFFRYATLAYLSLQGTG